MIRKLLILLCLLTLMLNGCASEKTKQTAAQETQQQTTAVATAKKTEQTTAAMEIAQAQTGAGETTAVAEEMKVENDSQTEEA